MAEDVTRKSADFYEKSVDRFGQWVQFEDAKAGAVLVLLGIALSDLLGKAFPLIHAHKLHSHWGTVASIAFWIAIVSAATMLGFVIFALIPRTHASEASIFYFGSVAGLGSTGQYEAEAERLNDTALAHAMASQAWQLGRIATLKARVVGYAFRCVAIFLVAWAVARLALGLAG